MHNALLEGTAVEWSAQGACLQGFPLHVCSPEGSVDSAHCCALQIPRVGQVRPMAQIHHWPTPEWHTWHIMTHTAIPARQWAAGCDFLEEHYIHINVSRIQDCVWTKTALRNCITWITFATS